VNLFELFDILFVRIHFNTLHRYFNGTHASLIAVNSLSELMFNFHCLVGASEGNEQDKWAIIWYDRQLKGIKEGGCLGFRPEVKKYIKKWYMSERAWNKILAAADIEYQELLARVGIKTAIEQLLEKAKLIFPGWDAALPFR
jgi:hypothetical protein